jgi:hypothetical protein
MPDGSRIRFQAHNSKAQGDGGGMIRESAARQLARLNGQRLPKNLYAIYMVVMGSNYAFKGQFILVPDRHFPKRDPRSKQPISPDISLIIDLECFNEDVWSSKATKGKMLLKKHKPNTRLVYVEPLIQWKVTSRLIDPNELTTVSAEMAKIKLNEEWRQAITKPQDRKFGPDADPATATTQLTRQDRAEKIQAEKNAAYVNYLAANRSIWASTSVIDRVFNRTVGNYQGHIEKSLPLPGIMASGETLNFVHSFYAEPDRRPNRVPKGFIRLISLRGKPSQLVGFAMNEKDQQTYMFANDTMDGDDTANVNFIRHDGQIRVFLKRPQMSIDGGVILRLSPRDQRFALRHYHVYNQIGHHFFPKGLYDIVDGKPNYPDRLKAKQTKVTWSTDPENFLDTLMKITKDRGIMGRICNAAALLDYGDLWQENFKFSMSGEVIDAHLNGTGNAANILEFLHREILKAMQKDQRMDPCVYPRVEKHLKAQNDKDNAKRDAKGLAPLPMPKPNLKCGHGDKLAKDTSAQTIEWLKISVNRAKNLTNGPKAALVTDYNPKIAKLVSFYFKQRNQTWARAQKDAALVREDKDIPYPERLIAIANLEAAAAAKEAKTIRDGYSACIRREGYQPGTFTAYWGQMALSRANRWDNTLNNGTEPKAVSVHVLDANLPNQERIAFQHLGKAVPTLIIPTDQRYLLSPKGKCTIQKSPKGKYTLTTPSGRKHLATLGATARHYAGLELQVVGYIPDHSENLRQAENLLVLQIKDPENLSF